MDISKGEQQASQPFFPEVEALATSQELGALQTSYTKKDDDKRLFVNALVWMSVSILGMIFVITLVLRLTLPGPFVGLSNYLTAAVLAIIGFVILYGCFRQGLLNLRAYQYRNREQVHIYTEGMVYLEGQATSLTVRWEQIEELTRGDVEDEVSGKVKLDRLYLALQHDPEQQIFFQPALPQRLEICARVEQAYTSARLPNLLARYRKGDALEFDSLLVSKEGVSIPRALGTSERDDFSWNQLTGPGGGIEVDQPYTTIRGHNTTNSILFREFTCEIANACLLKALIKEV
ncbi:MAG: hypothetical protein PVS3B1_25740 [Ktedonobacteraceae bacterium]